MTASYRQCAFVLGWGGLQLCHPLIVGMGLRVCTQDIHGGVARQAHLNHTAHQDGPQLSAVWGRKGSTAPCRPLSRINAHVIYSLLLQALSLGWGSEAALI